MNQPQTIGTGVGGASDRVKKPSGTVWNWTSRGVGGGTRMPKTTSIESAFLLTLTVAGAFSSCFLASAIFLHIEQGASPLNVFWTPPTTDPSCWEYLHSICPHAADWSKAQ